MSSKESLQVTRDTRAIGNLSIVIGRKADFISLAVRRLREATPLQDSSEDTVGGLRRTEIRLIGAAAKVSWKFFVTESEIRNRKLDLATRLEDLDREAVWREISKRMSD